ncbi:ABC transporter ATP-binding protein [soil metagenome]
MSATDPAVQDGVPRPRALSNGAVLAFVARQWMRRKRLFTASVALTLLAICFDLMLPWAAGRLIDAVSQARPVADIAWSAWGAFVGVYVAFSIARNLFGYTFTRFAAGNMRDMTNEAFARMQGFSTDWHADSFGGATVRKLTRAMWGYDQVSDAVIIGLVPAMLVLCGLSVSMWLRWPVVGWFSLVVCLVYMTTYYLLTRFYARPANLRSNAYDSRIGATVADAVSGNAVVKSFAAEQREEARLREVTQGWTVAVIRTWTRFTTIWAFQNILLVVLQAGLTGLLVWLWSQGRATPGDVAFAISSHMLMSGYLRNFGEHVRVFQKGLDDVEDVAAWMRQEPEVRNRPDARDLGAVQGEIVFEHVTFTYRNKPDPLFVGLDLSIAPGERIALVGATGSGKSTFVKLTQRLHDLQAGRILIDGQDIAHVTQRSLREAIAVVPQDPALFHRSIAENIGYARPDATREQVMLAARRAMAHDFISRLPDGYDTLVGERGVKLSGGERQRVAIARAFLADAPILVLDEATSSLDVETERQVQRAIDALMTGRTAIVIAHRLSTVRGADRILVFDGGRIVEQGRHDELLAIGGIYAHLTAVTEGLH